MAAHFLHGTLQPSTHHITHVWHTADPIAMGTCTGSLSTCGMAGYAMESRCHLGNIIEYDTVTNLSWSVRLTTHPIATVIDHVLSKPWPAAEEQGLEVPPMKRQDDCVVRVHLPSSILVVNLFAGLFSVGVWEFYLITNSGQPASQHYFSIFLDNLWVQSASKSSIQQLREIQV